MTYRADFTNVSTAGLESSPLGAALAGLRAIEARCFKNEYDHVSSWSHPARRRRPSLGRTHLDG
jgi:hypothetical protein